MTLTSEKNLPNLEQLPSFFTIELSSISAISLSGEEQNKYLQGQVTCDVNASNNNSLLNGSHCDAKGKVFSVFRFIKRDGANLLIQPKNTLDASIKELKKFGVFAKVDITQNEDLAYFALCGDNAKEALSELFSVLPSHASPVEQIDTTTLVFIEGKIPRYLIIDSKSTAESLIQQLNAPIFSSQVWNLLEIIDGFPVLSNEGISAYVPQMLNLQAVNAISFTKGCYLGQETVARMQYLGKNKRALFTLKANNISRQKNTDEFIVEKKLGDNWRKAGDVLAAYIADSGELYLQTVLSSDTSSSDTLRLKSEEQPALTIQPLPYSLNSAE